jgi:glucokinase
MDSRTLIGVDLGGTNMRAGRVEAGALAAHAIRATPSKATAEVVLEELCGAIGEVLTSDTAAIGIGVPSVVDVERGIVYTVENIPSWQEVHLKQILERRFGVPVYVNNDANCFAVGEFHFGQGQGFRHMVGMVVGTGLGAGVILNGHLYSGANCGAGEIGTIPYRGETFEYFASGQRFPREHGVNGAMIHAKAAQGDPEALKILADFGEDFGQVIMTTLYAFDPEIIVLGGSVSKAFPFFEKSMRKVLGDFAYQRALQRLLIRVSEEPQIAILGAAALGLDALS